jgi:hypothetical protein
MGNLDLESFLFDLGGEINLLKTVSHYENHMKSIYGEDEACWPCISGYNNSLFFILDQGRISDPYLLLTNAINGVYVEKECNLILNEFRTRAAEYPLKTKDDYSIFEEK